MNREDNHKKPAAGRSAPQAGRWHGWAARLQAWGVRLTTALRSRQFFWAVAVFFAIECLWVAFSAVYPMAFDEDFHFGLIKLYAHHWSPFLSGQPPGADAFGAVARDPSYLYHYAMSFPYRLLALFTHSQTTQVIALRLLNVAMFGAGLFLFRRLLRRAGCSAAFTNLSLLLFVLIPITPVLAAQVNYDNALMPLMAWACWLAFDAYEALRARRVPMRTLAVLLAVCLLGSLVKYAFLPVFAAAAVFVLAAARQGFWPRPRGNQGFWAAARRDWAELGRWARTGLVALVILSGGLFVQRYGVNVVRYHTPIPDCAQVLSTQACSAYGPWQRNYSLSQNKLPVSTNPLVYTGEWFYGMWLRLFFAVNGPASGFATSWPLPLPSVAAIVLAALGVLALALGWRRVFRGRPMLAFFALMIGLYCAALWLTDYKSYLLTHQPVAINGRYLLPILLPVAAIAGRALSVAWRRRPQFKPLVAAAALLLFLEGGGVLTFIARSDDSWYWPNSAVQKTNHAAHRAISPVIVKHVGKKP